MAEYVYDIFTGDGTYYATMKTVGKVGYREACEHAETIYPVLHCMPYVIVWQGSEHWRNWYKAYSRKFHENR